MPDDLSIREISVEFARTIAHELRVGEGYFEIEVFGPEADDCEGTVTEFTQRGEDMIERYIRRAIETDRRKRA